MVSLAANVAANSHGDSVYRITPALSKHSAIARCFKSKCRGRMSAIGGKQTLASTV
jgi:hypothetical protein